jgi:hypothetical protein
VEREVEIRVAQVEGCRGGASGGVQGWRKWRGAGVAQVEGWRGAQVEGWGRSLTIQEYTGGLRTGRRATHPRTDRPPPGADPRAP